MQKDVQLLFKTNLAITNACMLIFVINFALSAIFTHCFKSITENGKVI